MKKAAEISEKPRAKNGRFNENRLKKTQEDKTIDTKTMEVIADESQKEWMEQNRSTTTEEDILPIKKNDLPEMPNIIKPIKKDEGISKKIMVTPKNNEIEKTTVVDTNDNEVRELMAQTTTSRTNELNAFIEHPLELEIRKKHIVKSAAFISNKGGVGKTHIASNMSFYLARLGKKVLLIDLDLGNSDITNKLGFYCKNTINDMLNGTEDVDQLIYSTPYGFDLISGESGNLKLANLTPAQKNRFIKALKQISNEYDFVLYDLSAGISTTTLDFALAQDYQNIITTPQDIVAGYSCIKATFFRFIEVEKAMAKHDSSYKINKTFRPFLVLNQVPDFETGRSLFDKISDVSKENIKGEKGFYIDFNLLGVITTDPVNIRASELKHYMYSNSHGASKTGQCFHFLSHNLTQYRDPNNMEFKTKFKRFINLFLKGVDEFKYAQ